MEGSALWESGGPPLAYAILINVVENNVKAVDMNATFDYYIDPATVSWI